MVSSDITYYLAMDYSAADAINGNDESLYEEYNSKLTPGEPVIPTVRDILCGRGGLTNHNPGNAWFRELVRKNRDLYRTSPKHYKLLVAKSIVTHVLSQNCRFLERHRNKNQPKSEATWGIVSYKHAVDKTSQALRERERSVEHLTSAYPPDESPGTVLAPANGVHITVIPAPSMAPSIPAKQESGPTPIAPAPLVDLPPKPKVAPVPLRPKPLKAETPLALYKKKYKDKLKSVKTCEDQFADPEESRTNGFHHEASHNSSDAESTAALAMVEFASAVEKPPSPVGALCRVCKQVVIAGLDPSLNPELSWRHGPLKELHCCQAVAAHVQSTHPHWPLWNVLSYSVVLSKDAQPLDLFCAALATGAHAAPHKAGDAYDSAGDMCDLVSFRMGLAQGWIQYKCTGPFVPLVRDMLTDYRQRVCTALRDQWNVVKDKTHQERVDLLNNLFLVPYCILNLREKGNLFPPVHVEGTIAITSTTNPGEC